LAFVSLTLTLSRRERDLSDGGEEAPAAGEGGEVGDEFHH